MKVFVVNDHFLEGGASRVAAIQCNELFHTNDIDIVLVTDLSQGNHYYLNSAIPTKPIDVLSSQTSKLGLIRKWSKVTKSLRKYIQEEKPDVIIAIQARMFLFTYLANIGLNYPIIVADHTSFNRKCGFLIDFVRNHLYAKASGVSILTQKDYNLLGKKYPNKKVIYNPLSFDILTANTNREKTVLCAGRLDDWSIKGFDIIIKIWSHIASRYPEWTLCIAGDGRESSIAYIDKLINECGLNNRVKMLGRVNTMKELYANTSIFALPSRIEGFPMVLMEAMSQGCACIAFDVYGASSEMVTGDSGLIIKDGDVLGFEKALIRLIEDDALRLSLQKKATNAVSRFSVEEFGKNWDQFIKDTIKQ